MANMMDYLNWRGDLSFRVSGFNEVDNLILAQLAYVDFAGIVPEPGRGEQITLREASKLFWKIHSKEEILSHVPMMRSAPFVLKKMAETKRFRNILLSDYIDDISDEEQSQFSVLCAELTDGSMYVAFSGTDNTIVGWRENFNMGYLDTTPGQLKAVEYLNGVARPEMKKIRVGGHSKGGNLSVYAAVKCEPWIQNKITCVYSNDGPGFDHTMVESRAYQSMLPRIKTILPESSIVGMLLEHEESYEVVKSSQSGIQQHDAMSWEVLGTTFVYVSEVAQKSILLDEAMKTWLRQLSREEREQIVETIFLMLEEAQIKTVDDFYNSKWKKVQELLKAKSKLSEESQKLFGKALKLLWSTGNKTVQRSVKKAVQERLEDRSKNNSPDFLKKV
ncbi:MAG: Mbeg1-like protein [Roseburia sp.]